MRRRLFTVLLGLAACGGGGKEPTAATSAATRPPTRSVRITMDALHQAGGIPTGWHFTVPPGSVEAGRRAFADLGCPSCHRVAGESFADAGTQTGIGPDLTGMGSHHPAEYFAESILNPDAVLVDAPGYIDGNGRSVMPSYPDLTLGQLADLVAYLRSLRAGGAADMMAAAPAIVMPDLPAPPAESAGVFWVQSYDVQPGHLQEFEEWFAKEGRAAFLARDGVVRVDTYVDVTHARPWVVTVLGFRDDAALSRFLDDGSGASLGQRFDDFIGPHQHRVFRRVPVYRAPSLSAP
jgi:mono/diheme cytochrome c family protein